MARTMPTICVNSISTTPSSNQLQLLGLGTPTALPIAFPQATTNLLSFRTEQADAFSSAFAPANASACAERNLSSSIELGSTRSFFLPTRSNHKRHNIFIRRGHCKHGGHLRPTFPQSAAVLSFPVANVDRSTNPTRATRPNTPTGWLCRTWVLLVSEFKNRLAICSMILLSVLFPAYGRAKPHYTFILPDQYVGWVQLVFNDPGTSPLPVRRDGGREIDVPESGIPRTSGLRVHDVKGKDEFYYLSVLPNGKAELRPVPSEYVLPGIDHGGFGVADTGGQGPGYSWFIFIGPPEIRARIPWADITKVPGYGRRLMAPDVYPTPGRMPSVGPSQLNHKDDAPSSAGGRPLER